MQTFGGRAHPDALQRLRLAALAALKRTMRQGFSARALPYPHMPKHAGPVHLVIETQTLACPSPVPAALARAHARPQPPAPLGAGYLGAQAAHPFAATSGAPPVLQHHSIVAPISHLKLPVADRQGGHAMAWRTCSPGTCRPPGRNRLMSTPCNCPCATAGSCLHGPAPAVAPPLWAPCMQVQPCWA